MALLGCGKSGGAAVKTSPSTIKLEDFRGKFAQVQKSMTESEVIALLGNPQDIHESKGRVSWGYQPVGNRVQVWAIVFENGKVHLIAHF